MKNQTFYLLDTNKNRFEKNFEMEFRRKGSNPNAPEFLSKECSIINLEKPERWTLLDNKFFCEICKVVGSQPFLREVRSSYGETLYLDAAKISSAINVNKIRRIGGSGKKEIFQLSE